VPNNEMGIAMALPDTASKRDVSMLGSMLFARCVSGCRAVSKDDQWGPHVNNYHSNYLALSCSIGMTSQEGNELMVRLDMTLRQWRKKIKIHQNQETPSSSSSSSSPASLSSSSSTVTLDAPHVQSLIRKGA